MFGLNYDQKAQSMTQRDLSTVILKLFGVSHIIGALVSVQTQSVIQYLNASMNEVLEDMKTEIILSTIMVMLVQLIAGGLLIRFSGKISALLFKENSEAVLTEKIKVRPILEAGIPLIALFTIISVLPTFLPNLWYLIKSRIGSLSEMERLNTSLLIEYSITIALMIIVILKSKSITAFLDRSESKSDQP